MFETEARLLWSARQSGETVAQADLAAIKNVEDAYGVQAAMLALADAPLAGWKLGATAPATMALLGVGEPFAGPVFARDVVQSGAQFALHPGQITMVETELAVVLGAPLPARNAPYTRDAVAGAVAEVRAAFEIVALRFDGGPGGNGHLVIADGAINGGVVLGDVLPNEATRDPEFAASLAVNGDSRANGGMETTIWDDILDAVIWLADRPGFCQGGLNAGHLIMAGTMTGMNPIAAGDKAKADFAGNGGVEAIFVQAELTPEAGISNAGPADVG